MDAGNATYLGAGDLPRQLPLFPLAGALLLPQARMPLNIFEPRYLAMIDAALSGDRVIGMIQPDYAVAGVDRAPHPPLRAVGCAGRIVTWQETGDGRYLITLVGIARFDLVAERDEAVPYRVGEVSFARFAEDFTSGLGEAEVDREELVRTLRAYLEANDLEADWDSIGKASTEVLVNALSMMSPYGPAEKQALLEAPDLKTRAETLVALTEVELARRDSDEGMTLQ